MGIDPKEGAAFESGGFQSLPSNADHYSIPYEFLVTRNDGQTRPLAVPHPRHQLEMVYFYKRYGATILHFAGRSPFSIRRPLEVAKYTFDEDQLHKQLRSLWALGVETSEKEPERLRSYFVYGDYSNIYKFYESRRYQELEKRYSRVTRLDISKCFASIYTHSVAWALYGKDQVKRHLHSQTFAEHFDELMQRLNYNETNGIVVGPEFSRLFAEVILQAVDRDVIRTANKQGIEWTTHFEVLRYVDDYFIFSDDEVVELKVEKVIDSSLRGFNLYLNETKKVSEATPTITPISIAKMKVSELLRSRVRSGPVAEPSQKRALSVEARTRRFITEYKLILRETGVEPVAILNYALSVLEKRIVKTITKFQSSSVADRNEVELTAILLSALKFGAFAYAASPRVNPTVKLSRICTHIVDAARHANLSAFRSKALLEAVNIELRAAIDRSRITQHSQIERQYLLTTLRELGRSYLLAEPELLELFEISKTTIGEYVFEKELSHFSAVTLLHYMESRDRYSTLRGAVAAHILARLKTLDRRSCERALLGLDAAACPYLSLAERQAVLVELGANTKKKRESFLDMDKDIFVAWRDFDLGVELDAKRNQEVY